MSTAEDSPNTGPEPTTPAPSTPVAGPESITSTSPATEIKSESIVVVTKTPPHAKIPFKKKKKTTAATPAVAVPPTIPTTQLTELNSRSRWYSSQLWQIPVGFWVATGSALANAAGSTEKTHTALPITFFVCGVLGFILVNHLFLLMEGQARAVTNLQNTEKAMKIPWTAELKHRYAESLIDGMGITTSAYFASWYSLLPNAHHKILHGIYIGIFFIIFYIFAKIINNKWIKKSKEKITERYKDYGVLPEKTDSTRTQKLTSLIKRLFTWQGRP